MLKLTLINNLFHIMYFFAQVGLVSNMLQNSMAGSRWSDCLNLGLQGF